MISTLELTGTRDGLAGFDFTFVPGDPPRSGRFAAFRLDSDNAENFLDDKLTGLGEQGTIELALPAAKSVRRRRVAAILLPIATALPYLLDLEDSAVTTATARFWASVSAEAAEGRQKGRVRRATKATRTRLRVRFMHRLLAGHDD